MGFWQISPSEPQSYLITITQIIDQNHPANLTVMQFPKDCQGPIWARYQVGKTETITVSLD